MKIKKSFVRIEKWEGVIFILKKEKLLLTLIYKLPTGLWDCSIAIDMLMDVKYSTVLF